MPRLLTRLTLAAGMSLAAFSPALAEKINVTIITASDMDTMSDNDGRGGVADGSADAAQRL